MSARDARVGKLYCECSHLSLWKRSNETNPGYATTRETAYVRGRWEKASKSALKMSDTGGTLKLSQGYKKVSSVMVDKHVVCYVLVRTDIHKNHPRVFKLDRQK